MAITNGGNVKAPEPPGPPGPLGPIITLSVSGDFTYPQVKGQYVNCTGLILTCTVRFEGNTWVDNIDCSGLCDGTDFIKSGSWNIFVSTNSAEGERYALWDNSGEQYIILTAYSTTIGGSDSVTKTVTVAEPEPTEKIIINAELYEAVEGPPSIIFDANSGRGSMEPQELDLTSNTTTLNTRDGIYPENGKRFLNWNTEANGSGTSYIDGQTITTPSSGLELYAQWSNIIGYNDLYWYYQIRKTSGVFKTGQVTEWTLMGSGKGGISSFSLSSSFSRGDWNFDVIGCLSSDNVSNIEIDTYGNEIGLIDNIIFYAITPFTASSSGASISSPFSWTYTFNTDEPNVIMTYQPSSGVYITTG